MDNQDLRKWYTKKRFIIPIGVVGLLTAVGLSGNSQVQPTQSVKDQTSLVQPVSTQENTTTTPSAVVDSKVQEVNNAPAQQDNTRNSSTPLSNNNYYENVSGNEVHSPAYSNDNNVPSGASAQCGDGTYSFSQHRSGTCSHHGGVATWY